MMGSAQIVSCTFYYVNLNCHLSYEQATEADGQDEQHDVARNTVWRTCVYDVGNSQFLWNVLRHISR